MFGVRARGSSLDGAFNEAHIVATTQAIVSTGPNRAPPGRCSSAATPCALGTGVGVCAVLAANDVIAMIDSADRYADSGGQPRDLTSTGTRRRLAKRHRGHAVAQPAARRVQNNPPSGPADTDRRVSSPSGPTRFCARGSRAAGALAGALQTAQRHDYMDAYVEDLPNRRRADQAGHSHRRRPLGRASVDYWGDRRTPQPEPDRGQSAGRRDISVRGAGYRRQDPHGLRSPNAMAS